MKGPDLTGSKFGFWLVLSEASRSRGGGVRRWNCRCKCGKERIVHQQHLVSGQSQSCSCKRITHGLSKSPEFKSWASMKSRCSNPKDPNFYLYGGRGIRVCERWASSFEAFREDMGVRPTLQHTIDRIDNNGNYEPGNCRWASKREQSWNRRCARLVDFEGEQISLAEACHRRGLKYERVNDRIKKGWTVDRAMNQPVRPY